MREPEPQPPRAPAAAPRRHRQAPQRLHAAPHALHGQHTQVSQRNHAQEVQNQKQKSLIRKETLPTKRLEEIQRDPLPNEPAARPRPRQQQQDKLSYEEIV